MNLEEIGVTLNIEKNGIYCLGFYGATGKTYLYELLQAYQSVPGHEDDVLLITYDVALKSEDTINRIKAFGGKLIMLDRLDLYYTRELYDVLKNKEAIVLIDYKNSQQLNKMKYKLAYIRRSKDRLEVFI